MSENNLKLEFGNSENQYNINPKVWGPAFWDHIFFICFSYPDNPTTTYMGHVLIYFENLQHLLPCEKCRVNYANKFKNNPIRLGTLQNKKELIMWCIDVYNSVRVENGKEPVTYKDIERRYMSKIMNIDNVTGGVSGESFNNIANNVNKMSNVVPTLAPLSKSETTNKSLYVFYGLYASVVLLLLYGILKKS